MSKIFDAYRKRVGVDTDLSVEIGRSHSPQLFPNPGASQKREFSHLAARLQSLKGVGRGSVLCVASSTAGEGASFVSYHTAVELAQSYQKRVAWIDGNFLSPQGRLRSLETVSFAELLENPDRLSDLAVSDGVTVIPGGSRLPAVRGLFSSGNYAELLTGLSGRFDFTIIDLPPILSSTDATLMATGTDGLVLVVEQRYLKREIIEHGLQELRNNSVHVLGSVINRRTFELPKFIYDRL